MNPLPADKFKAILKKKEMKETPQRLAVHSVMCKLVHAGAEDVWKELSGVPGLRITKSSVYNILEEMCSRGIYSKVLTPDSRMVFDVCAEPHMHLVCENEGPVMDIENDELTDKINDYFKRRRFRGFKIEGIRTCVLAHPTKKPR